MILSFKNRIKDYNLMVDGTNFFDQGIRNELKLYENVKIAAGHGGDYAIGCVMSYLYFKEDYKLIAIILSKQQRHIVPKAIKQINFTGNLDWAGDTTIVFILDEERETILNFFTGNCEIIVNFFLFNIILI